MNKQIYNPSVMKRINELDLLKAIAIIAMVFIHVFDVSTRLQINSGIETPTVWIIEFMGNIPSAGVFMFAMGWGAAFSSRSTPSTYISRLRQLVILGILINFFEHFIPSLIDPATFGTVWEIAPSIFAVDIYFFAAFAMIYFAVMKKFKEKPVAAVSISAALIIVCFAVNAAVGYESFTTGNSWIDTVIGLFIRENEWSYFPFISWIIFPVVGYGAALLFKKATSRKAVLLFAGIMGVILIAFAEIMMAVFGIQDAVIIGAHSASEASYYALHPLCAICGCGVIAIEFIIANLILMISRQRLPKFTSKMSRNVMEIYIAQWLFIGCLSPVLSRITNLWVNILFAVAVTFASYFGAELYKWLMMKNKERRQSVQLQQSSVQSQKLHKGIPTVYVYSSSAYKKHIII